MEIVITIKGDEKELNNSKKNKDDGCRVMVSSYARFFDETCPEYKGDSEFNMMYLRQQEQFATDKLRAQGYLFLNDVYTMLGLPRSKAGQVVGWVYNENNPVGDNYVDFDLYAEHNSEFVNGYEKKVLLDFNVDGMILDFI